MSMIAVRILFQQQCTTQFAFISVLVYSDLCSPLQLIKQVQRCPITYIYKQNKKSPNHSTHPQLTKLLDCKIIQLLNEIKTLTYLKIELFEGCPTLGSSGQSGWQLKLTHGNGIKLTSGKFSRRVEILFIFSLQSAIQLLHNRIQSIELNLESK